MTTPADAIPPLECYRLIRAQIEFEDQLIAQRLSWFVAAQAFLFSAYAVTLNAPIPPAFAEYRPQQLLLYHLIPAVAIASCVLLYLSIIGGVRAQTRLRRMAEERIPAEQLAAFPPIQGCPSNRFLGRAASLVLPIVFVAAWLWVVLAGLLQSG